MGNDVITSSTESMEAKQITIGASAKSLHGNKS